MKDKSVLLISDWRLAGVFTLALAILLAADVGTYRLTTGFIRLSDERHHAHQILEQTEQLLTELVNAETGQRGYLITGDRAYLEPYDAALPRINTAVTGLAELTKDDPLQRYQVEQLQHLIATKLDELRATIDLRRAKGFEPAQRMVLTNLGKGTMDAARRLTLAMLTRSEDQVNQRYEAGAIQARRTTWALLGVNFLSYALLFSVFVLLNRQIRVRKQAESHITRLNAGLTRELAELTHSSNAMSHDLRISIRHISGFANILLEDFEPLDASARECLEVILNSASNASQVLGQSRQEESAGEPPSEDASFGTGFSRYAR